MPHRYTDTLINAFSAVRAWQFTTLGLGCLSLVLVVALIHQGHSVPVVLVPCGAPGENVRVKVAVNGSFTNTSPDYLAQVALGDLALILNWQPANVEVQFQRFLDRASSELYARENVRLIDEAKQHRSQGDSQSYYPESTQVNLSHGQVVVDGVLVRWTGSQEAIRARQRFVLTYLQQHGYLHIANVETK